MRHASTASHLLLGSLLGLSPLLGGCSVLQSLGVDVGSNKEAPVAQVGALPNATCQAHWSTFTEAPLADPDAPAEAKVTDALCWPLSRDDPRPGSREAASTRYPLAAGQRPYVRAHFAFDDREPDLLQASLIVTGCVDHGTCEAKRSYVVGQVAAYADMASPDAVERALSGLDLPDAAKSAYLQRYGEARAEVLGLADAMPEDDVEVCREIPQQVRERRAGDYETFDAHYQRFEALWPRLAGVVEHGESGDAALMAEAAALRDEHVAACVDGSTLPPLQCWHATIARPLTEAIAQMAVRQGDGPRAWVEQQTLESGSDLFTAGNEISYQQSKAMGHSSRAYTAWDRMPTVATNPDLRKEVAALTKEGVEWVTAKVERVEVSGEAATIHLQTRVSKRTDSICKETNKVDRIENGKVYYKKKCRAGKTHVTRTTFDPVSVPAADVRGLEREQMVKVAVDSQSRRGHLMEVLAEKPGLGGKPVRLRLRSTPLERK